MQAIDIPIKKPKSIKELIEIVLYIPIYWRNFVRTIDEVSPPKTPPKGVINIILFFILMPQEFYNDMK